MLSWCAIDDEAGFLYLPEEFEIVQGLHQYLLMEGGTRLQYLGFRSIGRQVVNDGTGTFRSAQEDGENYRCGATTPVFNRFTRTWEEGCTKVVPDRERSSTLYATQGGVVTPTHTAYITTTDQRIGSVNYDFIGLDETNSFMFYKGVVYAIDLRTGALRKPAGTEVPVNGLQAKVPILDWDLQNPEIEGLTYWASAPGFPGQLHIIVALQEWDTVGGQDNYSMLHLAARDESLL